MTTKNLNEPLVSICIPVFNAERFVAQTLTSLCNQTYKNLEIIVTDDGSTDRTCEVVEKFDDKRIKLFKQLNLGAGAARNNSFKNSNGDFIKFMDGDDLLNKTSIAEQIALSTKYPSSIVSSKWGRFYNDDINTFMESPEKVWTDMDGINWITISWLDGPNMTQPGIFLLPRNLIEVNGLWIEDLSRGPFDDMEFFTKMILAADDVRFSEKSTLYYRSGIPGSLSKKKDRIGYEKALKTIKLSVAHLISKTTNKKSLQAAATQYKSFLYDAYPEHIDLVKLAEAEIHDLGGSEYKFQAGGYTAIMVKLLGWKITKRIKYLLKH